MAVIEKRANPSGDIVYRVKVRLKGCPPQTATFSRITDAKKWAQDTESAIRDGRHFKNTQAKRHTLGDLIDRYVRDVLPNKTSNQATIRVQGYQLKWWKSQIGHYVLADVTPALLAEYRDKLASKGVRAGGKSSPSTVIRYMAALSHAFTIAVKEWGWLDDSPMRKVSKPKEPRGRVRFLSDEERKALLEACKESNTSYLYPLVVLALSTGMRLGEILRITWPDINLEGQYIILHETKNGERRRVPLTGHALDEVRKLSKARQIATQRLFPHEFSKDQPLRTDRAWAEAVTKAGIEDFRFHDLRHSAASYLAMNGASLAEIAEVLGHKTLQMVKRYAHLSDAHTSKVVASMNAKIFG